MCGIHKIDFSDIFKIFNKIRKKSENSGISRKSSALMQVGARKVMDKNFKIGKSMASVFLDLMEKLIIRFKNLFLTPLRKVIKHFLIIF